MFTIVENGQEGRREWIIAIRIHFLSNFMVAKGFFFILIWNGIEVGVSDDDDDDDDIMMMIEIKIIITLHFF